MRDINLLRGAKQVFESFVREAVIERDLSGAKKEAATEIKLEKFSGGEKVRERISHLHTSPAARDGGQAW